MKFRVKPVFMFQGRMRHLMKQLQEDLAIPDDASGETWPLTREVYIFQAFHYPCMQFMKKPMCDSLEISQRNVHIVLL